MKLRTSPENRVLTNKIMRVSHAILFVLIIVVALLKELM